MTTTTPQGDDAHFTVGGTITLKVYDVPISMQELAAWEKEGGHDSTGSLEDRLGFYFFMHLDWNVKRQMARLDEEAYELGEVWVEEPKAAIKDEELRKQLEELEVMGVLDFNVNAA